MSDDKFKTRPATPADIVDLLIAHGHINPADRERILRGDGPTQEQLDEMQRSPLFQMLRKQTEFDESTEHVPVRMKR